MRWFSYRKSADFKILIMDPHWDPQYLWKWIKLCLKN